MNQEQPEMNPQSGIIETTLRSLWTGIVSINYSFWITALILAFLYVPMSLIILLSFNQNINGMFPLTGLTLKWYETLAADAQFWASMIESAKLMVTTSTLSILLALPAVYGLVRLSKKGHNRITGTLSALLTVPLYTPIIFIGIALLLYFSELNVQLGFVTRLFGHVVYIFPFTFLILFSGMRTIPGDAEEAARDLGATQIEAFVRIVIPQLYPSIVSSFIFGMLLSLNEFIITFMVSGTGTQTVPLLIFTRLRHNLTPEMNAIGAFLLVLGFGAALIAARFDPRIIQ